MPPFKIPLRRNMLGCFLNTISELKNKAFTEKEIPHSSDDVASLRDELLSEEQLKSYAAQLSKKHVLSARRYPEKLLPRLNENEKVIDAAYNLILQIVRAGIKPPPAGEWLLDNYYIVHEHVLLAREHLPRKFSRELPVLEGGGATGTPRIYHLAIEFISHTDGRVDKNILSHFVSAYQSEVQLRIGELWAVPIMLRLALLENLRRVSQRMASGHRDYTLARKWSDRLIEMARIDPKNLVVILADMSKSDLPHSSAFVAELSRNLQGKDPSLALALGWFDQRLLEVGLTAEGLILAESQGQAADQVTIGNIISSIRVLSAIDWQAFVEEQSSMERILGGDPSGLYSLADFETRDACRHAVERISKMSKVSENDVANKAIMLSRQASTQFAQEDRRAHVGYYLIDRGMCDLARSFGCRARTLSPAVSRTNGLRLIAFASLVLLISAALTAAFAVVLSYWVSPSWVFAACVAAFAVTASQTGVALANSLLSLMLAPQRLPRMDFDEGIPPSARTLVTVPTILSSKKGIDDLIEGLEIRYLGNRDPQMYFSLLTDSPDAARAEMPEDAGLIAYAKSEIERLNAKYIADRPSVFFLFHRPRLWNASENVWMGYERKRGKLRDLNHLLRGHGRDHFLAVAGELSELASVRYVISLDTDTLLPPNSARKLVATMAHILNRPVFDKRLRRIVDGYGVLQPRMALNLRTARQSWFVRIFAPDAGIDPYTRTVSDVYQDLFGEGSFVGKGIYDVDAFEQACGDCFPDNRILSHDLIEGCYARAGLVSDIELFEDFPSRFNVDARRRHRWMRGDWQIGGWLLPYVPKSAGTVTRNPLSLLSVWKIFDNLRRSVVPIAALSLLLLSWIVVPFSAGVVAFALVFVVFLPMAFSALLALPRRPRGVGAFQHAHRVARDAGQEVLQSFLVLVFLPFEALQSVDVIVRTQYRLCISGAKLLEWQTASDSEFRTAFDPAGFYREMSRSVLLSILILGATALLQPEVLYIAAPWTIFWLASPGIAWFLSRSITEAKEAVSAEDTVFLRELARRTWRFFDTFVNASENWLPPDNFQEIPRPIIAHRTSPTNVGVALLSTLAAHDFGYVSITRMLDRVKATLSTLEGLPRYRGHFYNWYDTKTGQPLSPMYISSVDSGNLVGHLLTLRSGLLELSSQPLFPRGLQGLADSALCLRTALSDALHSKLSSLKVSQEDLDRTNKLCDQLLACKGYFSNMVEDVESVQDEVLRITDLLASHYPNSDIEEWCVILASHFRELRSEVNFWTPWLISMPAATKDAQEFKHFNLQPNLKTLLEYCRFVGGTVSCTMPAGVKESEKRVLALMEELDRSARRVGQLALMKFDFLYDEQRKLLAIGYNVTDNRIDNCFYNLLASEARLASYVCIARGQLPLEHWFLLGRNVTEANGGIALLSWSGSMFEYLMPLLVMPTYTGSLLDQTCRAVIVRQKAYAQTLSTPWGISESGYNTQDLNHLYQYRAFGVPGLGFKRGLNDDAVIAPYACVMAVMFQPQSSTENLRELVSLGAMGAYGFYEALDFTPSRISYSKRFALVQSYMAHHQGMTMLALAHQLLSQPMQRRFMLDPELKAADLLLQERLPKFSLPIHPHSAEESSPDQPLDFEKPPVREYLSANTPIPHVQLLSNGRYHVMVTHSGTGYSRWKGQAVTRWSDDAVSDCLGQFCYLRDRASAKIWSTAHQPIGDEPSEYLVTFSHASAEFHRVEYGIASHQTLFVSPENDVEIRRLKLTNRTRSVRQLDFTTYAEVVLCSAQSDNSHPAFSKLFVQTEILPERQAILCTRRTRGEGEGETWMFHLVAARESILGTVSFETDRARFIGRGRDLAHPKAMEEDLLSCTEGSVLDPIVSIRLGVELAPSQALTFEIVSGVADSRESALALISRFSDHRLCDRAYEVAWTNSRIALAQLNISEADAQAFCNLAAPVLFSLASFRADPAILARNRRGQSGVWGYGISGDFPIVLLRVTDASGMALAREALSAHAYLRMKGLAFDLVICNEDGSTYRQVMHDELMGLVLAGTEAGMMDQPGGVFIRRGDLISEEDRVLLQAMARVVLSESEGTLVEQLLRSQVREPVPPRLIPNRSTYDPVQNRFNAEAYESLDFYNGYGGFAKNGKEYVIHSNSNRITPAPWCNVLANSTFGSVLSERGSAYTWSENAREYRLSPWHNDPICDSSGEAFYIRDEETGHVWSPCPWPVMGNNGYETRHGFGYSVFKTIQDGIESELTVFVDAELPVKLAVLRIRNMSMRRRRLSVVSYVEWVLGDLRSKHSSHVVTEADPSGVILARNPFNTEFSTRIAFCAVNDRNRAVTCDRAEFIGRNRSLVDPAALQRTRLSGKAGAGLDSCCAQQSFFELPEGRERDIVFLVGVAVDAQQANAIASKLCSPTAAQEALDRVRSFWTTTLTAVQVKTPKPEVDFLVNGWLQYQVLASRVWARSGYYQSGGAYGFRDQLQDVLALLHSSPHLARQHIIRCASHQFVDGDVQHWWHPPVGRGVRTQFSDDYLWLPYALCQYVFSTGDQSILHERAPYLQARAVKTPEEEAYYDLPQQSEHSGTVYEHCVTALRRATERLGEKGLPLMGCGDWNDGMNRVGIGGRGESVWLAFFLYDVLRRFSALSGRMGDEVQSQLCLDTASKLQVSIEANAWDGKWYRRAYFDDGTPLGSAQNEECRIDSIPQSWAVLSSAGSPERARQGMAAVDEFLVHTDAQIIHLFTPPFDKSKLEPGYIKAYLPGVRENGGQYTHAAVWTVLAFAELNNIERAWELMDYLNPILHGSTPIGIERYKIEPYVVAADIYGAAPHTGRGGWSWYTGSAGWMYRLLIESLLGLQRDANMLCIRPRLPKEWTEIQIAYRFGSSTYTINIHADKSKSELILDGVRQGSSDEIMLVDDRRDHTVELLWSQQSTSVIVDTCDMDIPLPDIA